MSTWTALCEELSQCERQITAIRLKADERVQKEVERASLVAKKHAELLESHARILAEATEEFEHQMSNVVNKAEQEIQNAANVKAEAGQRARIATERAEMAEQKSRQLEIQIAQLHGIFDRTVVEHDRKYEAVIRETDAIVRQKEEETSRLVRDASRYASEIQEGALDSIGTMQTDLREKIQEAEAESKERSRFQDLYNVALNKGNQDISEKDFEDMKNDLIRSWYQDWNTNASNWGTMTMGTGHLRLEEGISSEMPLAPLDPERPRSVERARQRATELKQEQHGHRPRTAP